MASDPFKNFFGWFSDTAKTATTALNDVKGTISAGQSILGQTSGTVTLTPQLQIATTTETENKSGSFSWSSIVDFFGGNQLVAVAVIALTGLLAWNFLKR
jgi:hypothetical protein